MILRFTPTARRQFLRALTYIADDNLVAAQRFRMRVERVLRRLEQYPKSGRRLPEFPELPHREVIVRPYRFFYHARGRVVWVVAVWHGAQRPTRPDTEARRPTP